jgi:ribosomal protein L19E
MPYILNNPIQAYRNRTKNSRNFTIQKGILKGKGSANKRNSDLLIKRERKERNELAKQKDRQTINQVGENSGPPLSN